MTYAGQALKQDCVVRKIKVALHGKATCCRELSRGNIVVSFFETNIWMVAILPLHLILHINEHCIALNEMERSVTLHLAAHSKMPEYSLFLHDSILLELQLQPSC